MVCLPFHRVVWILVFLLVASLAQSDSNPPMMRYGRSYKSSIFSSPFLRSGSLSESKLMPSLELHHPLVLVVPMANTILDRRRDQNVLRSIKELLMDRGPIHLKGFSSGST
ncbi:uncharacterized protein LOC131885185 [Tigriopus californicus]|uniref:uncharacterized protein LOC131885185 n=1 Tax=Tigriopus californicus TaxID=6832 RepID=UPI0027DA1860|nr:uncharacterized protein LOC131885185 [Tigriopus californicus]